MALKILLRILFVVFAAAFALNALQVAYKGEMSDRYAYFYTGIATLVALGLVFFEWRYQRDIVREMVATVAGLAAGLVITTLIVIITVAFFLPSATEITLAEVFATAFGRVQPWIPLILVTSCYVAVTVVLQTRNDFRFLVPYIDFSQRGTQEGGMILDTSAIIDGRFAEICETSIITAPVIIPDFVIRELQLIADSTDRLKRMRGRRGLDIVARLQQTEKARVVIRDTDAAPRSLVDEELVRLAKELNGRIITTDFNLNKVGLIEGIEVVNVNDLANAIKPVVLPGESLELKIIRRGQEAGQGVGYLDDGTMVVVEGASGSIGETIIIAITGTHQTSAGRMIFGKINRANANSREA